MSLPNLSGTGRLTQDPALRFTPGGKAVVEIQIAFNARKFNRDTQQWEDGSVCYLRATAWEQRAENIANTLSKGDAVAVSGRLKTESWEKDGQKRSAQVLELDSCGPDLDRATATVNRMERASGGFGDRRPTGTGQIQTGGADDPWGSAPPTGQQDPEAPF